MGKRSLWAAVLPGIPTVLLGTPFLVAAEARLQVVPPLLSTKWGRFPLIPYPGTSVTCFSTEATSDSTEVELSEADTKALKDLLDQSTAGDDTRKHLEMLFRRHLHCWGGEHLGCTTVEHHRSCSTPLTPFAKRHAASPQVNSKSLSMRHITCSNNR